MVALLDEWAYTEAIAAVLADASDDWEPWQYDSMPGSPQNADEQMRDKTPPRRFVLLSLERRINPSVNAVARTSRSSWRLSLRCAGSSMDEARGVAFQVASVLNEASLTVGDRETTRLQFESQEAARWDGASRYVSDHVYTFTH